MSFTCEHRSMWVASVTGFLRTLLMWPSTCLCYFRFTYILIARFLNLLNYFITVTIGAPTCSLAHIRTGPLKGKTGGPCSTIFSMKVRLVQHRPRTTLPMCISIQPWHVFGRHSGLWMWVTVPSAAPASSPLLWVQSMCSPCWLFVLALICFHLLSCYKSPRSASLLK